MSKHIADHLAVDWSWLSFEWNVLAFLIVEVRVSWSAAAPPMMVAGAASLKDMVHQFVARSTFSVRRKSLNSVRSLCFGLRASRGPGVTALTQAQPHFVKELNRLIKEA
eukprot:4231964-Amphidinium_carterae.1